ncbi:MAG: hypothetical protein PHS14_02865 [Elusimicrobia bacterium]|nr:hypothetical protein [Elusimicrobiota bacterium]
MALELRFISKKEGNHMAKHKLAERTHVYVDPKTREERIANFDPKTGDKDNVFLLGAEGAEIELERAEALGLVKAKKAGKDKE